jgi:hypothetical protein
MWLLINWIFYASTLTKLREACFLMSLLLDLKGTGSDWNVICKVLKKTGCRNVLERIDIYTYILTDFV